MIQRQQTLWLLLAALGGILSYRFSFFSGASLDGKAAFLKAGSTFLLMIMTGLMILLSLVIIFLFKDRKLQFRLCLLGIALSAITIILYFVEAKKLSGNISLWAIFVFAIPIGFMLAARGIRRDEKIVKTLDKLRN